MRPAKPFRWVVADVETGGLDSRRFLFCGVYDGVTYRHFTAPEAVFSHLEELAAGEEEPLVVYFYNAQYDLSALCSRNPLFDLDEVIMMQSRFICGTRSNVTYACSINLLVAIHQRGTTLKFLAKMAGYDKPDTPSSLKNDDTWPREPTAEELDYNRTELRAFHALMTEFFDVVDGHGVGHKPLTLAQNSHHVWLTRYCPEDLLYKTARGSKLFINETDDRFRHAYYGGRSEVYRRNKLFGVTCWDVRSMYPSVMSGGRYPRPDRLVYREARHLAAGEWETILRDCEGMACGVAFVPEELDPPPLPLRRPDDTTVYPSGSFAGAWCFPEIRLLLELGGRFELAWTSFSVDLCSPFTDFVGAISLQRQNAKNEFQDKQAKFLNNSLYGKMGQKGLDKRRYRDAKGDKPKGKGEWVWVPFTSVSNGPGYWLLENPDEYSYGSVLCWASYVTSYARVKQARGLLQSRAVYGDTDSAWAWRAPGDDGGQVGDWRIQVETEWARFYSPKAYQVQVKDGPLVQKCKGVPASAIASVFARADSPDRSITLEIPRLTKMLEAAHRGRRPQIPVVDRRVIHLQDRGRLWMRDDYSIPHRYEYSSKTRRNYHICCGND